MVEMSMIPNDLQKEVGSLYDCVCRVVIRKKIGQGDGSVRFEDELLYASLPCRLSYETVGAAKKSGRPERQNSMRKNDILAEEICLSVKLFFSPTADIPPGSTVVVSKAGEEYVFVSAGIAAVYPSHKEIILTAREKFA